MRDYDDESEAAEFTKVMADNARAQGQWQGVWVGFLIGVSFMAAVMVLAPEVLQ